MQLNQGDSWLLVVGSQIGNLTLGPSFGHNLCLKYPNGSCERILEIKVPKYFQWYKELLNPMNFDPCNHFLNIQESIKSPIPKMGTHLGMWRFIPSHPPTLLGTWNVTLRLRSWPTPLQAFALVSGPRLRLRHFLFWCIFLFQYPFFFFFFHLLQYLCLIYGYFSSLFLVDIPLHFDFTQTKMQRQS
jgi:hypothetical protein